MIQFECILPLSIDIDGDGDGDGDGNGNRRRKKNEKKKKKQNRNVFISNKLFITCCALMCCCMDNDFTMVFTAIQETERKRGKIICCLNATTSNKSHSKYNVITMHIYIGCGITVSSSQTYFEQWRMREQNIHVNDEKGTVNEKYSITYAIKRQNEM